MHEGKNRCVHFALACWPQNRCDFSVGLSCPIGPSDAARAASLLKRQRSAGRIVYGAAAKSCRRKQLQGRALDGSDIETQLINVGAAGVPYATTAGVLPPLLPLPEDLFTIEVCEGEETCLGSLREYHRVRCEDQPATEIGRSVADDQGWGGQLQRLAADGCPTGSRSICNTLVIVHERCTGEAVGLLAMCFTSRGCLVQAIHVVPRLRGPLRLPEQLWRKARAKIACEACEQQRRSYRVTAETACNQAPAAAAFWIYRCGWEGSADAVKAASSWMRGDNPSIVPGQYQLSCTVDSN